MCRGRMELFKNWIVRRGSEYFAIRSGKKEGVALNEIN